MKKLLAMMAVLAVVALAVNAGAVSGKLYGYKVAATQANATTTFPTTSGEMTSVSLYNAGANEVFVNVNAAATTSSVEIPAGATVTLSDFTITSLGVICSAGETTTLYIFATAR